MNFFYLLNLFDVKNARLGVLFAFAWVALTASLYCVDSILLNVNNFILSAITPSSSLTHSLIQLPTHTLTNNKATSKVNWLSL